MQTTFLRTDRTLFDLLGFLVLFVPALLGVFLGAPLVARELEHGTHRLAWTQSVSRTRWLAVKIAVIGLAGMAVAGFVSLFVTWWAHPLDRVRMDQYAFFDQRGVVPVAYAAFAIALGVACGIFLRRTLPAMAATLAGVRGRTAGVHVLRPVASPAALTHQHLALVRQRPGVRDHPTAGDHVRGQQPEPPERDGAVVAHRRRVGSSGERAHPARVRRQPVPRGRPSAVPWPGTGGPKFGPGNQAAFNHCIQRLSDTFHLATTYQPPSRYWPLQWSESGIFMAAALVLVGVSLWRIRRAHG